MLKAFMNSPTTKAKEKTASVASGRDRSKVEPL